MSSTLPLPFSNQTSVPRLFWATDLGDETIVRAALKEGDDVNAHISDGQTALHRATKLGHNTILNLLLTGGADITAIDNKFQTPLHYAANAGANLEAAKILLNLGADVNALDNTLLTPLHMAVRVQGYYSVELITLLLDKGADVNTYDLYGRTPLHKAAKDGCYDIATMLLERGADVNALDHAKNTPLHAAVKCCDGGDSVKMIKLLVKWGADAVVNAADEYESTALHWAALGESEEVVELLLGSGADVNAVDDKKRTPLDRAIQNTIGMMEPIPDEIQKLLERSGGLCAKDIKSEITDEKKLLKTTNGMVVRKGSVVGFTREGISLRSKKSNIQIGACKADDSYSKIISSWQAEGSLRNLLCK